ncbi:MAG: class D beta-lactamase [Deltaproteobacteria bacterium]|nr:class D beta-lactamase [Deltaproteobacteria bacterium]
MSLSALFFLSLWSLFIFTAGSLCAQAEAKKLVAPRDLATSDHGLIWRESPPVAGLFAVARTVGTFALYDAANDSFTGFNQERAETGFTPASTFKIFNTLIGLETGAVKDVDEILPWGGWPQPIKAWEKDLSLREAIKVSSVPIFQELARRVGLETLRSKIAELAYGDAEIGQVVDRFWLDGPLKISAVQQARLLARLAKGELPFARENQAATRDIIKLEAGPDWALYGKTGTASRYDPPLGWWVGWVEKGGQVYSFALNIDMPESVDAAKRVDLGRAGLKILGLLE